jgi:hypothetical protein
VQDAEYFRSQAELCCTWPLRCATPQYLRAAAAECFARVLEAGASPSRVADEQWDAIR